MNLGILTALVNVSNAQLNFSVLGNWGANTWTQKQVASKLAEQCARDSTSFVVSPGSNFTTGIDSLTDSMFKSGFSDVYNNMKLPFYNVLGVEDWRRNVTAQALWSQLQFNQIDENSEEVINLQKNQEETISQKEIASLPGPKFVLPNWYWHNSVNFADASTNAIFGASDQTALFLYIDTYILSDSFPDEKVRLDAWNNLEYSLATADKNVDWLIVVGDSAIYSSGKSGNNKELEANLRPLLKQHGVDLYISGNDYDMEVLEDGAMTLLNCGNGSYGASKGLWEAPGSLYFSSSPGFCSVRLAQNKIKVGFYNGSNGELLNDTEVKRQEKSINVFTKASAIASLPPVKYNTLPWGIGGSIGPDGEGHLISAGVITFIKVVGSLGLAAGGFTLFIAFMTSMNRIQKVMDR